MSETPRLSRRELRELGKLDALPADDTALTETAEMRLRRPSRKELREAAERERAEMEARQSAETIDDAEDVPAEDAPTGDVPAEDVPAEGVPVDETPADETPAEEPVADDPVADESVTDEAPADESGEDDGGEATQAMDAIAADDDEPGSDVVVDTPENLAEAQQRKSVFDRFEDDSHADAAPAQPEHADEETVDEIDGDEDLPLRDRFLAMTSKDEHKEPEDAADAPRPATPVSTDESDSVAVAEGNDPAVVDDYDDDGVEVESPNRRWLIPLLVIVLGLLVGYLAGSWLNKNYLSESVPYVATTITNLLL